MSYERENTPVLGKLLSKPLPQWASWLQPQTAPNSLAPLPIGLLGHLPNTQFLSNKGRQRFSPDHTNYSILVENYTLTAENAHARKDFSLSITFWNCTCCVPYTMLLIFIILCFSNRGTLPTLIHIEAAFKTTSCESNMSFEIRLQKGMHALANCSITIPKCSTYAETLPRIND